MSLKYAELERNLGEIDRARAIFIFASNYCDPRSEPDFWKKWNDFEVLHGNEDTFREMLRVKRSVMASFSQTHFILPEYAMQKDQKLNLEEAVDTLKKAGLPVDEMAALERQLAAASEVTNPGSSDPGKRFMNFVSAGVVESQPAESAKKEVAVVGNGEEIELPEDEDEEDDANIEVAQKTVPDAVFGELGKRAAEEKERETEDLGKLGALERIKRQRKL